MEDTRQSWRLLEKMSNKTDDKDDWEKEDTFLDKYKRQKELKKAATTSIAKSSPGLVGTMERMSSANDYIAKALESSPQGWIVTSINQTANNPISYHGYEISPQPGPEVEVNIKVSDPQLIATLHHAMQGYF